MARIALYPDELIAVITGASLYPLQIVEAPRYLDQYAKDKSLKPKESWDGSVISLLNYPEVVKMMSDDLEWTQSLGDAIAYQQKDVLIAIQQLRDEAVAKGVIKTDDKVQVDDARTTTSSSRPADPEKIYVPQYQPQMLYEPDYLREPIRYYPDPYPSYWYPGATFFAGAVTGAIWAAAVDWDDWGVWGGSWDGGDIDIDCNNCFNNRDFNGKLNFNDVDWKNIDRSKINIDRDQFNKIDRDQDQEQGRGERRQHHWRPCEANIKKRDRHRQQRARAKGGAGTRISARAPRRPEGQAAVKRPICAGQQSQCRQAPEPPAIDGQPSARPIATDRSRARHRARPASPSPAAKIDNRPKKPSGLGNVDRGKAAARQLQPRSAVDGRRPARRRRAQAGARRAQCSGGGRPMQRRRRTVGRR